VAPEAKGHSSTKQVRTMLIATQSTVFWKHIYQEVKHRKFVAQHKAMAEKKKNKRKRNEIALWILKIGW
jgi:hypothetical protein